MVYRLILDLPHPVAFWGVVRGRRKQMRVGVAGAKASAFEEGNEESEKSPAIYT